MLIVTTDTIPGKKIEKVYGYTKGSSVRSKNIGSDILAGLKNIVGGEIEEYKKMMDDSRQMAMLRMIEEAEEQGANAIIGMKMVSSTIAQGVSEITVYGTAVFAADIIDA